jgi:hypothetical protein
VILGLVIGGLAVMWGVVVAFLDQPAAPDRKRTQLCAALLTGCAAAAAGGILVTVNGWW